MAAKEVTSWLVHGGERLDSPPPTPECAKKSFVSSTTHHVLRGFQGLEWVSLGMSPVPYAWRLSRLGTSSVGQARYQPS